MRIWFLRSLAVASNLSIRDFMRYIYTAAGDTNDIFVVKNNYGFLWQKHHTWGCLTPQVLGLKTLKIKASAQVKRIPRYAFSLFLTFKADNGLILQLMMLIVSKLQLDIFRSVSSFQLQIQSFIHLILGQLFCLWKKNVNHEIIKD